MPSPTLAHRLALVPALAIVILSVTGAPSEAVTPAHPEQSLATITCATLDQDIADIKADLLFATGLERIYDMRALRADYAKKAQMHCP